MSRKAAPRREVVEVVRKGDWGDVTYAHRLNCGHTEIRKRPAKSSVMACESCLLAKRHRPDVQPVAVATVVETDVFFDPFEAEMAFVEGEAGRIRAGLAARLRVPLDAVDVVVGQVDGRMGVQSAMVFLDASQARALADSGSVQRGEA